MMKLYIYFLNWGIKNSLNQTNNRVDSTKFNYLFYYFFKIKYKYKNIKK